MVEFREKVMIDASPARVWAVLAAIERWPNWTPTMSTVECLEPGPPAIGMRVRITQPRLKPAVWEIDDWRQGQGFSWTTASPGLKLRAEHTLTPRDGGCMVALRLCFDGILARPVAWLAARTTRRYLEQEARGLKRHAESSAAI